MSTHEDLPTFGEIHEYVAKKLCDTAIAYMLVGPPPAWFSQGVSLRNLTDVPGRLR